MRTTEAAGGSTLVKHGLSSMLAPVRSLSALSVPTRPEGSSDLAEHEHESSSASILSKADLEAMLASVQQENRQLKEVLGRTRAAAAEDAAAARREGEAAAKATYARDDASAIRAIETGIKQAIRSFDERLSAIETLAALMSRAVIEKVLGPDADMQSLVSNMISIQTGRFRSSSVLGVCVSASDFPEGATPALVEACARLGSEADIRSDLEAGEARIMLRLGEAELSVPRYWRAVSTLLDEVVTDAIGRSEEAL